METMKLSGTRLVVFNAVAKYKRGVRFAKLKAKLYPAGHDNSLRQPLQWLVREGFVESTKSGREATYKARG